MSGAETFEFAAAVAGVSIGLVGLLLLAFVSVVGVWRLFRHTSDVSTNAGRALLAIEELGRRLAAGPFAGESHFTELRQQADALLDQQRRLQEMAQALFETPGVEGGPSLSELEDVQTAVGRLDANVGQMAASLANLIQFLEQRERR